MLITGRLIPEKNPEDALHIGIAAAEGIDYLITWNFTHINNAETKNDINKLIENFGFSPPILCSPEELGGTNDQRSNRRGNSPVSSGAFSKIRL